MRNTEKNHETIEFMTMIKCIAFISNNVQSKIITLPYERHIRRRG